ncbi:MAG: tRNA lysidine(34) synthetase TilS [Oscillospiraceae bacterium]|jgi:tRNA(Ile)-lysidine synthase|nr:tRNA lysidine(34) synthetase TilS [Oscillospiraceae bacterium]
MNLELKIKEAIDKFSMLKDAKSIVVALSGGIDSVSLLHFLKKKYFSINILAAHVNHNLRGQESALDEKFVKNLCKLWNIKLFIKSLDVFKIAKDAKQGIEECARELRYNFLEEISEKTKSKIAVAHTLSDSLETVIFNFARGSGIDGLKGISAIRGKIIRPLIFITRNEIEVYAKENNLQHITDSSNFSSKFSRNRIRMFIIPQLKKINPSFEHTGKRFLYQINRDNDFLKEISEKENVNNIDKIKYLPEAIRHRVLKKILCKFYKSIEYKHVKLADNLLYGEINSFTLPTGIEIKILNNQIVEKKIEKNLTSNIKNFIIKKVCIKDFKLDENKGVFGVFDASNSNLILEFRTRRAGDVFYPQKRGCGKTLKKFFNEMKVPVYKRNSISVLAHENEIIWMENFGVSEKYKITYQTNIFGIVKFR